MLKPHPMKFNSLHAPEWDDDAVQQMRRQVLQGFWHQKQRETVEQNGKEQGRPTNLELWNWTKEVVLAH
jgi:hypothetical protein